mgnify:FL=1
MNETTNLKLKKPAGNEYISVETINGNMDIIDAGMKGINDSIEKPEFDASGTVAGITDKTTLLASFVTRMPLVKFMRNVVAGFKLVLYAGQVVNNCVTDNAGLPLSAAQGKVLMDLYTVLNTKIADTSRIANTANAKIELDGPIKVIAYGSDKNKWAFQLQFPDGVILSLGISETEIFYDYYDGAKWVRKWTR